MKENASRNDIKDKEQMKFENVHRKFNHRRDSKSFDIDKKGITNH